MIKSLLPRLAALTLGLSPAHDSAEDWGLHGIVPVSAPAMVLEAVDAGTTDGTVVSINRPAHTAHQKFRPLAGSPVKEAVAAEAPWYEPPPIQPEDIRPGVTKQFCFARSRIFPGIVRDVTVFIPARYDGNQPACIYVKGPTQVILPVPDRARVLGVCLGGKDKDMLFAFWGDKIWRRKVQHHAMGAFTPWTRVIGTKAVKEIE